MKIKGLIHREQESDWPQVAQEAPWLGKDSNLDLPGLTLEPLHHPGSLLLLLFPAPGYERKEGNRVEGEESGGLEHPRGG